MPKSDLLLENPESPAPRDREAQAEFLINASDLLMRTSRLVASQMDVEATLQAIAALVLPHPRVWSILAISDADGTRQIASPHASAPPRAGSVLTVPLASGGHTLGSLTFVAPFGGHVFDDRDRQLAQDVGAAAGLAIVTARLAATREQSLQHVRDAAAERRRFIVGLSHGLRTPLHAIHGYAQLLDAEVRGPLNDGQRQDVHRIQANERHLLDLVNSVIGFARWDDGEALALEDIPVRTAVRLTNTVVERAAAKRGVTYDSQLEAPDADLVVRAEPRRLREILLQLLLNAVEFSRAGDRVSVLALEVGDKVWIRVTDTGVGIEPARLASIFEPFSHASDEGNGDGHGVGLGLAITQKLTRSMGGELSVTSEPGRGSTFTLALPRGRLAQDGAAG